MEKKLKAPAAPATQLEVLVGVANGLLVQNRKLKEIEGKFVEADEAEPGHSRESRRAGSRFQDKWMCEGVYSSATLSAFRTGRIAGAVCLF